MTFQFVQILFWLSLSTWFGAVMFIALAAPIIFRTVRDANPVLPGVLSVNMEGQHGTLLAGSIVSNLLAQLRLVQIVCALVLLVAMIAQLFLIDLTDTNGTAMLLRALLFTAAVVVLLVDWLVIHRRIERFRQQYLAHADEPDIANPAKDQFDLWHARSVSALQGLLFCVLGIILFSGSIMPKGRTSSVVPSHAAPAIENSR
jgi:hypothetical protein